MTGLVGQLDGPAAGPGDGPGHADRLVDQRRGLIGVGGHRGREAEGPVHHHPKAHSELDVLGGPLQPGIPQAHLLRAEVFDP